MRDRYFDWLCDILGDTSEDYNQLLLMLYERIFVSIDDLDDNRITDGILLRDDYLDEVGTYQVSPFPDYCNILEMLIGVAKRLEDELPNRPFFEWFWVLVLDHLGLANCDDSEFLVDSYGAVWYVEDTLLALLDREYSTDGLGGLFPLKRPKKDQRRVSIWDQMGEWIKENFPVF